MTFVQVIRRLKKMRVREIGIPLYIDSAAHVTMSGQVI